MSGTAALAAAKRRRAVPTNEVKPSGPAQTSSSSQPPSQQGPVNPLTVLIKHDKQISDLENKITQLKFEPSIPMSKEDITHFKSQYNSLVEEIQALKKIIINVQTFSMEMNIEILNVKRLLKNDSRILEVEEVENDIKNE